MNNLKDISMRADYATLCGITEAELHRDFDEDLHELALVQGMTFEKVCNEVRERYNGYYFAPNAEGVYNPFSLLNAFDAMQFGSYWFATGTPSYLVSLLKSRDYNLERLTHEEVNADALDDVDTVNTDPIPVIYQSGYLTIKGYDPEFATYRLGFPNREVEEGFIRYLKAEHRTLDSPSL